MKCSQCQTENKDLRKFCSQCGAPLSIKCAKCGFVNEPEDRFCGECGQSLASTAPPRAQTQHVAPLLLEEMQSRLYIPQSLKEKMQMASPAVEGENRLVTVMFADISGFTAASEQLAPEQVAELASESFKAIVDPIIRYEGNINRFIGDCVLAFFGAPTAHENDAERAILAAIDIVEAMQKLNRQVTIGINTGMMYIGTVGAEVHQEYTVEGHAVNLAKRLQEAAKPGQIIVGSGTYRLTRKAFDFKRMDSLTLKNIKSPVVAYEVLRVKEHPEKLRGLEGLRARMIGREHEFAELKEATDQWLAGQGQIVSIIGEAGIGKSRLVTELKAYIQSKIPSPKSQIPNFQSTIHNPQSAIDSSALRPPPSVLEGRCVSIGQPISYWPFLDILRSYFNLSEADDEKEVAQKVTEEIQKLFPQSSDDILPFLGHLLSIRFHNKLDQRLQYSDPEQIRHQTLMRLKDLFVTLAKEQPLLLILEDLHWADDLSLDLISFLMDEIITTPMLLLCVYRPEREHRVWQLSSLAQRKCLDRHTEITLKKLSNRESRQLVETLLTIDNLPESVKEMIMRKSEGNPFFIEEVLRSLIDRNIIYQEGERWKAKAEIVDIDVPDTIQSVILMRVDRLRAEAKYVLQCASIIGRLFKYRLLEHLTRHERDLDRYLEEFEARELVYEERTIPELEYAFKHALTQEATYQGILERSRREFHQQVAEGIEMLYAERINEYYEQLAYHYDKSGPVEKAIEYLLKAGEKARKAYLNNEAIGYFQRALEQILRATHELPLQKVWQLEALKGLGMIYYSVGKLSEAEEYLRRAIALGQEMRLSARELVRLYFWLVEVIRWQSRYDEMIRIGEEGLALLEDDTESFEAALMNATIAAAYFFKGDKEKFLDYTCRNEPFIQRLPYSEELRPTYQYIVIKYTHFDKNVEEAMKWLGSLEQKAIQHHDLRALSSVYHFTGKLILANRGDLYGAISQQQRALELVTKIEDSRRAGRNLILLGAGFIALGDLQKAGDCAYKSLELIEEGGIRKDDIALLYMTLGTIWLCQEPDPAASSDEALNELKSHWEKATNAFQKAAQLYRELGFGGTPFLLLGRAYLAQGKQEALKQFQEAIALKTYHYLEFPAVTIASALSGLEEAYDDDEEFRAFCRRFREEHPDVGSVRKPPLQLSQWYLEPTEIREFPQNIFHDDFVGAIHELPLQPPWVWHDPFNDCSFTVQNGLEIHAANGRDLWHINLSAPRILQPVGVVGEPPLQFAVQTVIVGGTGGSPVPEKPSIGGILLWKDTKNYLRLDKGTRGEREISFSGCIKNKDLVIGRGRLPSVGAGLKPALTSRVFLRLERIGNLVNALCSSDGMNWFTVGHMDFPVEDPLEVGLHAIGSIDRSIYHGAYPDGTAIRFLSFQLSTTSPSAKVET